jgi:hypothetical protein
MTAPLCSHCGRPVLGVDADLRARYEAACARVGWPALPAVHQLRQLRVGQPYGRTAQEAGCAAAAREVTRG